MIEEFMNSIWTWFSHLKNPLMSLRFGLFGLFILMLTIAWIKAKRKSRRTTRRQETAVLAEKYEKTEAGRFPWEEDTDDDPKRLGENARPVEMDIIPKRGKWG